MELTLDQALPTCLSKYKFEHIQLSYCDPHSEVWLRRISDANHNQLMMALGIGNIEEAQKAFLSRSDSFSSKQSSTIG